MDKTMQDDAAAVLELNRNYARSALESDVRWYAANLAEDFMASNPDGSLQDRAGFLARMAKPFPGSEAQAVEPQVRILGDVALVHSGFRWKKPDGSAGTGRYTDIYARRGGRWLCVSAHFNAY